MSAQHLLVVVADDGGVDAARNRGIVDAIERGAVSCTSLLANGSAFDEIAQRVRTSAAEPGVGLHLNLTEGASLSGVLPALTDPAGRFLADKHETWRRALAGHVEPDTVEREALAQLETLAERGLSPRHVDGHQHVHLLPGVREGLAAALERFDGIGWVRLPRPVLGLEAPGPGSAGLRLPPERIAAVWRAADRSGRHAEAALGTLAAEADPLRAGLRTADAFLGIDLLRGFSIDALLDRLTAALGQLRAEGLPEPWVVEVMTHPGECDSSSVAFSALADRQLERDALCDPALGDRVAELGFRLGRFTDAPERVE